jgi:hypothetical protein
MGGATYNHLLNAWEWKPIRNCPGRLVLRQANPHIRLEDLLTSPVDALEFKTASARDRVLVVRLDKGGLISYHRSDGSFLHTLNSPEGFQRKLAQLGINLDNGRQSLPLETDESR